MVIVISLKFLGIRILVSIKVFIILMSFLVRDLVINNMLLRSFFLILFILIYFFDEFVELLFNKNFFVKWNGLSVFFKIFENFEIYCV